MKRIVEVPNHGPGSGPSPWGPKTTGWPLGGGDGQGPREGKGAGAGLQNSHRVLHVGTGQPGPAQGDGSSACGGRGVMVQTLGGGGTTDQPASQPMWRGQGLSGSPHTPPPPRAWGVLCGKEGHFSASPDSTACHRQRLHLAGTGLLSPLLVTETQAPVRGCPPRKPGLSEVSWALCSAHVLTHRWGRAAGGGGGCSGEDGKERLDPVGAGVAWGAAGRPRLASGSGSRAASSPSGPGPDFSCGPRLRMMHSCLPCLVPACTDPLS